MYSKTFIKPDCIITSSVDKSIDCSICNYFITIPGNFALFESDSEELYWNRKKIDLMNLLTIVSWLHQMTYVQCE